MEEATDQEDTTITIQEEKMMPMTMQAQEEIDVETHATTDREMCEITGNTIITEGMTTVSLEIEAE